MDKLIEPEGVNWVSKAVGEYFHMPLESHLKLAGIKEETIHDILKSSYEVSLSQGASFAPDYDSSELCHLKEGLLRTDVEVLEGRVSNGNFVLQGAIFLGSAPDTPSNVTYRVLEDSTITCIPSEAIYKGVIHDEAFYRLVLKNVHQFNSIQRDWALFSGLVGKREHMIFTLIVMCTHSRLYNKDSFKARYQDLADFSGASKQHAQKIIQEASGIGAIKKVYGGFEVLDLESLCRMVDYKVLNDMTKTYLTDKQ